MGTSGSESTLGIIIAIGFPIMLLCMVYLKREKRSVESIVGYGLANRSFSTLTATCTMISTWICGGYLFGSVESIVSSDKGLVWTHTTWAFSISMVLNAIIFCDKLYEKDCITLFDPICRKFGSLSMLILYIPYFIGDIIWISMSFSTLRNFLTICIGKYTNCILFILVICVIVIAVNGGMTSQKIVGCSCFCIMAVLFLALVCFLPLDPAIMDIRSKRSQWLGEVNFSFFGQWIDEVLVIIFGGTCWQVYYQQILACKSDNEAFAVSIFSGFGILFFGIAASFIGIFVSVIDWSQISGFAFEKGQERNLFSYLVKYVISPTYQPLCVLLVIATTMGTLVSSIFSCATIFSINVYKEIIHKRTTEREVLVVWKLVLVSISLISFAISYMVDDIYTLFAFTSEIMYVFIFPQLLLSVWCPRYVNTYGCLVGFTVGLLLRGSAGVEILGLKPWWVIPSGFPFRFASVVSSLVLEIIVSVFWEYVVEHRGFTRLDFLNVFSTGRVYTGHHVKGGRLRSHSLKIIEM